MGQVMMAAIAGQKGAKKGGGKPITSVGHTAEHHNKPRGGTVAGPTRTGVRIRKGSKGGLNIGGL